MEVGRKPDAVGLTVQSLIERVRDVQHSTLELLNKLELQEYVEWPSLLENFAVISSQINTIHNILKNPKSPLLKAESVLPVRLALDVDADLERLTCGRVVAFNHQIAPDYLRTKPEPEMEVYERSMVSKASGITPDNITKQVNQLNKCVSAVLDSISNSSKDWDPETVKLPETCSLSDTKLLIDAVTNGSPLKNPPTPQQSTAASSSSNVAAAAGSATPAAKGGKYSGSKGGRGGHAKQQQQQQ